MAVQMAKAQGGERSPRPRAVRNGGRALQELGADLALELQDGRRPRADSREKSLPRESTSGAETQADPNLEVAIPLLRKHGRLILMAGRAAKPALPLGAFYPAELLDLWLCNIQLLARRTAPLCHRDGSLCGGR